MKIVKIRDARNNLFPLIKEALTGEDIIIAEGKKPLIKFVPYEEIQEEEKDDFTDIIAEVVKGERVIVAEAGKAVVKLIPYQNEEKISFLAQTNLSKIVEVLSEGGEVIIAKPGKAAIKLISGEQENTPRTPGGWEGKVTIEEDFDDAIRANLF